MNPGPVEEGAEVAKATVSALSSSPLMLGTMVLQIATIAVLSWWAHERNTYEASVNEIFSQQIQALIKQCGPIRQGLDIPLPIPFPTDVPRG